MDIKAFADGLSEFGCRRQPSDTVISFARRYRKMKSRNWNFWRLVIGVLKELMYAALRAPLLSAWKVAFCLGLLIIHFFVGVIALTFLVANKAFPYTDATWRGPPKLFIPIPKIETGGCARSDSLVHSLIF